MAQEFTNANFEQEVLASEQPVLVDFWAPWCPPCRQLSPVIDELAEDFRGQAKVGKLNIDDAQQLAANYSVHSIPSVLVFQNGEVVETLVGVHGKGAYVQALQATAAS